MRKLGSLAASVSTLALMSSGADANAYLPGAGHHQLTPLEIARLPQQTDINRQREFTVFLKPEAAGSADLVQSYFKSFGFRTQYFPHTNTVKLLGSFAQAARAGHFTYVPGPVATVPLRPDTNPAFPPPVANAIKVTTFFGGAVMEPQITFTTEAPTTMPVHDRVHGLAPFKSDFGAIYGYNNLYAAGKNGTGETVDIAACFGYNTSDLATYATDFGITPAPNVTAVTPNSPKGSSIEPDLDVQRVYGTAPGAAVRMFFSQDCTIGEFATIYTDIANDQVEHPAAAVTTSYGLGERLLIAIGSSAAFDAVDTALSDITGGAAQKVALFASSGDRGDLSVFEFQFFSENDASSSPAPLGQADVEFPASDPNVLAVGGTTLELNSSFTRQEEFAWSGSGTANIDGGSGGGVSNIWKIPSWQKGVLGISSTTYKNIPDVAHDASPESPVLQVTAGAVVWDGGTSAASPTWAATVALLKQAGVNKSKWPQYLYANAKKTTNFFTKITEGNNNRYSAASAISPGYYNNVTGLGVPCLLHFPKGCTNGE
jgi:subtilase family serine protease